MEHLIDIPGRLHSVAVEKHIAGTDQIYDDILKTTLDILNLENITDVKVQEGKLLFLNIQGLVLKEISITTEQKQSDWNLTDSTQVDFIKGKPTVYNKLEIDDKLITKQDIIDDIATIRSNAQAGATAYHKPQTGIPATDLASDVQSDLVNIVDIAQVIPEQASESNQLADKNFVNSSIATNTANYISDNGQPFQSLEHLEAYEGVLTNNDYAFIVGADSAGNTTYSRYKYNVSTHQWALEYILNNSSFTAEQWESISSGITSGLVAKLSALPTNSELTAMLNGKVGIAALNMYTKQVASEISNEEKYTGRHTITQTLHEVIYPNNNYRKTEMQPEWIRVVDARGKGVKSIRMHFDDDYNPQIETLDDKVVWQNTATQQIPAATSETNGLMSASDKSKLDALPTNEQLTEELGDKANSADLAEVATSGSYNDLSDKPTIPVITGKADKVSNATNGNFAALDSNGNLIDSGHKHSDYLTQHQDLTNYVQKSQTTGLLKNDGTVDTNTYLTQHQDISGKADKSEMSVVPGTGANADKTTITLKQSTSATVLTAHQDITGKENIMPITTATGATLTAVVGNYYRLDNVGTLTITLPTITGATKLQAITFLIACGSSALVTFVPQGSETILKQEGFVLEDNTKYEVTALWNGSEWTLSRVIYE